MTGYEVKERDLKDWTGRDISFRFKELMKDLVRRARVEFNEGESLLNHVSGPLQLELKLTLAGGRAILDRIEAVGYDVYRRRPVLTPFLKLRVLARALLS